MLELIVAFIVAVIAYQLGKWATIIKIANAAVQAEQEQLEEDSQRLLTVEKHENGHFYAFLDNSFIGQAPTVPNLVDVIAEKFKSFRLMTDFYTAPDGDQDYDQERQEIIDLLVKELGN